MGDAFYWALNMSLTAVVTALPVLLLRKIRRIPRRVTVVLWAAPFLRMCVPVSPNSPFSLTALLLRLTGRAVVVYAPSEILTFSALNTVGAAEEYFPNAYRFRLLGGVFRGAGWVWLAVAAALLLTAAALYAKTLGGVRDARPLGGNVYLSDRAGTPAVYGVLRPKIVLPRAYEKETLDMVLLHERAHVRRGDNLWRLMGLAAAIAHWFNPFVWLFLKLFLTDLELACDETALAKLTETERRAYAEALLACAGKEKALVSPFGGASLRARIGRIVSFRRMTALSALGFAALVAAILAVTLTNAG